MTYIKITDNLDLVTTVAEPIYQGEHFSKKVTFLVPETVGSLNTISCIAFLIYIRADGHPDIVFLERDEEMYNEEYYQYTVKVPEIVTRYAGDVTFWIEFFTGNAKNPIVEKTGIGTMHIIEHQSVTENKLDDNQITAIYQLTSKVLEAYEDVSLTDNEVILFE